MDSSSGSGQGEGLRVEQSRGMRLVEGMQPTSVNLFCVLYSTLSIDCRAGVTTAAREVKLRLSENNEITQVLYN